MDMAMVMETIILHLAMAETFASHSANDDALRMFGAGCHQFGSEAMAIALETAKSECPNLWRVLNN